MTNGGEAVPPANRARPPTPAAVLAWVAAARGQPWFPSRHAAATGTDRDALDDPLNRLRVAGLVRVAAWVRGVGQGYVLTADGETAVAAGRAVPDDLAESVRVAPPAIPEEPILRPFTIAIDPRPPVAVRVLFVANLLWFFVGVVVVLRAAQPVWPYLSKGDPDVLHRIGAVSGDDLLRGEWWRLASSCFVHIGVVHLAFNLFALVAIGPLAEALWGRWRFAVIYLLSGLAGSTLAMALLPNSLLAGASGAIWGVLMSLVAWFVLFRRYLHPAAAEHASRRLTVVIVLNAMFSFMPGISWQGHLGGGVAGFVTAVLLHAIRVGNSRRRAAALGLLVAFVAAWPVGLVVATERGAAWAALRRRAADEQTRRAARAAAEEFDRDVLPYLEQLRPERVRPVEDRAVLQLIRPDARRNADRVAESRAKLTELKTAADAARGHLTAPPVGDELLDRHVARATAFAAARARSLGLLLAMLDSPAVPDEAAWAAWFESRRAANALWEQFPKR